jgi:hypothetical protein
LIINCCFSSANKIFSLLHSRESYFYSGDHYSCIMWSQNNPFLYDIAAVEETDVENPGTSGLQSQPTYQQVPAAAAVNSHTSHNIKLPEFWPHAPGLWFARAECRFELMGIGSQRQMFCAVTDSLPYECMRLVADLVAMPPQQQPYTVLKERLMMAHALSPIQKAEKLFAMPQLGARRPSDLLAAMFEFCPEGEEDTALFKALFLTRLPAEVRAHVESESTLSLKQLAARADQLWLTLAAKQQAIVAAQLAVSEQQEDPETVAAMKPRFFKKKKANNAADGAAAAGQSAAAGGGQAGQAAKKFTAVQLCWKHAKFGTKAFSCVDTTTCQWPEN